MRKKNWWNELVVDSLCEEDCMQVIFDLDADISHMKTQIEDAKGVARQYGEYAEHDWFVAVNTALRGAKRIRQEVQERKGRLARNRKDARSRDFFSAFVDVAREQLEKEVWLDISNEAKRRTGVTYA